MGRRGADGVRVRAAAPQGLLRVAAADRAGDRAVPGVGRGGPAVADFVGCAVPGLGLAGGVPDLGGDGVRRHVYPPQRQGNAGIRRDQAAQCRNPDSLCRHDAALPRQYRQGHGRALYRRRLLQRLRRVLDHLPDPDRQYQPHAGAAGGDGGGDRDVLLHPVLRPPVRPHRPHAGVFLGCAGDGAVGLPRVLADAEQRRQHHAAMAGHRGAVRHSLRRGVRARGGAVLRAVRCQGALHRDLVRLPVFGHLRLGHHTDHRHGAAQVGRRPTLADLRLRGIRGTGVGAVGGADRAPRGGRGAAPGRRAAARPGALSAAAAAGVAAGRQCLRMAPR
ncbi:hypothetical protein CBM2592_B130105 [Cupriavidus taiwanensis]|nr:hypothetical protein CBM2588_B170105 [Cupriavidus taiwanensis]SOY66351.1 hypothetical protein CBM2592_B130105 [Cupriavidus taiwanensis]SOZ70489.1 hypothetical protein CBM2617_B160104 [Cupriavidus taiwanensis]